MPKAILEFNLPEETEEFRHAINGSKNACILEDVTTQVFRPARKHGYSNANIVQMIQHINTKLGDDSEVYAEDLIGALEHLYNQVVNGEI